MVVNVLSNGADPDIRVRGLTAPLPAPAFAPGWHPGLTLDYPRDLGVHSGAGWDALSLTAATARIADPIQVGAPIAVYASSSGGTYSHSTHLVHRNGGDADGALVIDPPARRAVAAVRVRRPGGVLRAAAVTAAPRCRPTGPGRRRCAASCR
jgi:hypothetical protein